MLRFPVFVFRAREAEKVEVSEVELTSGSVEPVGFERTTLTRSQLSKEYGLSARDLVLLESPVHSVPSVVSLERCIIVDVDVVKVLISSKDLLMFNTHKPMVNSLGEDVAEYLSFSHAEQKSSDLETLSLDDYVLSQSWEMQSLDAVLSSVCDMFALRLSVLGPVVERLVGDLVTSANMTAQPGRLRGMLPLQNKLSVLENQLRSLQQTIREKLNSEQDMLGMLLTERQRRAPEPLPLEYHVGVEMLLESFYREVTRQRQEVEALRRSIESAVEVVSVEMDDARNRLMRLNVQLSLGTVSLALTSTVAALFGMNLVSGLEDVPGVFWGTCFVTAAASGALFAALWVNSTRRGKSSVSTEFDDVAAVHKVYRKLDAVAHVLSNASTSGIDRQQFKHMLRSYDPRKSISRSELDLIFRTFDTDDNGLLDRVEIDLPLKESIDSTTSGTTGGGSSPPTPPA